MVATKINSRYQNAYTLTMWYVQKSIQIFQIYLGIASILHAKEKHLHAVDSPSFLCSEVDGSGSMLCLLIGGVLWMLRQPLQTIQVICNIRLWKGRVGAISKIDITNPPNLQNF